MIYVNSLSNALEERGFVKHYLHALALLREASDAMEAAGDTLIAAHIATPLALIEDRLYQHRGGAGHDRPSRP
ncbi:hypothetical protein [Sphingomonas faeni]|uniref:hypothetical protein n=1 Tax=Sphingomonas faeni TaxID=185950 RepID=UPI00335310A0